MANSGIVPTSEENYICLIDNNSGEVQDKNAIQRKTE